MTSTSTAQHRHADSCASGVCGTNVPPVVGSLLTGTGGLTLDAAAKRLAQGRDLPPLTDVQLRMVVERAEAHVASGT